MKKHITGLLVTALLTSAAYGAVSNRTYMTARDTLSNNTVMGLSVPTRKKHTAGQGTDVSVSAFYRRSHNTTKLAQYFGGGHAADANQNGTLTIVANGDSKAFEGHELDYTAATLKAMTGTLHYAPLRHEYGAHIDVHQSLSQWLKGLSLDVDLPVTHVSSGMRPSYSSTVANATNNSYEGKGKNLVDIFSGSDLDKSVPLTQTPLRKAKISNKNVGLTGLADLRVRVGYALAADKNYCVNASLHTRIPTGNKITGEYAFEPTHGGRQFGIGALLNGSLNLWRNETDTSSLNVDWGAHYEYQFKSEETRTQGLYRYTTSSLYPDPYVWSGGPYRCIVKHGTTLIFPLANVSTATFDVKPGSRVDVTVGASYRHKNLHFNVGYNLFYAQKESLTLKTAWDDTAYATPNYEVEELDDLANDLFFQIPNDILGGAIRAEGDTATDRYYVTSQTATTPAQTTHKVTGSVGYQLDTKTPIRIGAGGSYEMSTNNASVNSWDVWAKVGLNF